MSKSFPFVTAFLILVSSMPSWAWSRVSGIVSSVDPSAREIVLNNDQIYTMDPNVDMTKLVVGAKVTVTEETKDGQNLVTKVSSNG